MMAGQYDKAIASLNEALRLKPDHEMAQQRVRVAIARKHLGPKSLEIKPTFGLALYTLGGIYATKARYDEAIECYRRVLQIDPTDVFANYALGMIYVVTGNKTGAMQQYNILKDLNPTFADRLLKSIPK